MNLSKQAIIACNFYRHANAGNLGICILLIASTTVVSSADTLSGEQVYVQTCMVCHGDDGTGGMPGVPDLSGNKSLFSDDDRALIESLKMGIVTPGAPVVMPPNGGNPDLTEQQMQLALDYLRDILSE
jgi:mono/diheme cytochrome c family protein